jgi:acetate kinase
MNERRVLTLNSGSSSLKFAIFAMAPGAEKALLQGKLERIGAGKGHFEATDTAKGKVVDEDAALPNHQAALDLLLHRLPALGLEKAAAIGHRIVQGGPQHRGPEIVTPQLIHDLRGLCHLDPPHLPAALDALEAAQKLGPGIPQVACFDTSFHRTLSPVAQRLPLPRKLTENTGLLRYGFHGLSYEFIMAELTRVAGAETANGKVIVAHLGNGASMAAVHLGRSVDTTMGFTPAGGLVMSSRAGDLDPGILVYLLRQEHLTADKMNDFVFQQCGLKGVSDLSSDLRDLIKVSETNPRAREAIELFHYSARKALGSLVAALDGVETIVFTAGIGENAPACRAAICAGLGHLGLQIDPARNAKNEPVISTATSAITVRVIKTNEELVIARHTARLAFSKRPAAPDDASSRAAQISVKE